MDDIIILRDKWYLNKTNKLINNNIILYNYNY